MCERLIEIVWNSSIVEWADDTKQRFRLLAEWETHPNPNYVTINTRFELFKNGSQSTGSFELRERLEKCVGVSRVNVMRYSVGIEFGALFDLCEIQPQVSEVLRAWVMEFGRS